MSAANSFVPVDSVVTSLTANFDTETIQSLMERACVIEHAEQVSRGHAECLALLGLLQSRPSLLSGLCVLAAELDGATQWLLTGDSAFARLQLLNAGAVDLEEVDPVEVVHRQYGNIAMLSTFG